MAEQRSTSSAQRPRPRGSVRLSNPNVFSDDYALGPLELTDSHHTDLPVHDGSRDVASLFQIPDTPRRSLSFQRTPEGSLRRSGVFQPSDGHGSISSRFDEHGSQTTRAAPSVASSSDYNHSSSTAHRSIRSISSIGYSRAQSPYQGATGPSHPYGMYPQDIGVARTPSTATTSTIRQPERLYSGPNGPTQPYGLYTQNTVPEDDQNVVAGMPPSIGAGFPGLQRHDYQRRLGPDGEDVDDLIGPDGYAEQLPPYSRYANGVPPKYSSGIGSFRRSTAAAPPPLSGSQETLNISESAARARGGEGAVDPFGDSATELDSITPTLAAPSKDEGGSFKERVREKSRRKVCCSVLPCWLLALVIMAIIFAVFLGGVIGGLFAHRRGVEKGREEASSTVTVPATSIAAAPTTTVNISNAPDVEPLTSTPTNLPLLPTGSYNIVLENPSNASSSCLIKSSQADAWDCATGANLSINISMPNDFPQVQLSYPTLPNATIYYGPQPPQFDGQAPMILMGSRADSDKGPAWVFVQYFTKVVILRPDDLPIPLMVPRRKRSLLERWLLHDNGIGEPETLQQRGLHPRSANDNAAQVNDKPWYCFWNETTLEGLIFVSQNADTDSDYPSSSPSAAATRTVYSGASTTSASWTPPAPETDQSSASRYKRQPSPTPSSYPKVVKITERRNYYNAIPPYCQQMLVLENGQLKAQTNPQTGENIIVKLAEGGTVLLDQLPQNAPPWTSPVAPSSTPDSKIKGRAHSKRDNTVCECQWTDGG